LREANTRHRSFTPNQGVYLVARRELATRVRGRTFRIGTVLMVLLLTGYVLLQAFVLNKQTSVTTVGLVGPAQTLARPLRTSTTALGLHLADGNLVSQGVVEEKASRIVEILLSTVRPGQLLA